MKDVKCKDCKYHMNLRDNEGEDRNEEGKSLLNDCGNAKKVKEMGRAEGNTINLWTDYGWNCTYFKEEKKPMKKTIVFNGAAPNVEQNQSYLLAFDHFNKELFNGELERPMLTLSTNKNMIGGYFYPKRWKAEDGTMIDEIAINSNLMEDGNIVKLMNILIHEMVHLKQERQGKPTRNGYHNQEYADYCKEIDLKCKSETGSTTGQAVQTFLIEGGKAEKAIATLPEDALLPYMAAMPMQDPTTGGGGTGTGTGTGEPSSTKPKSGTRQKYTCPQCGLNIWGREGIRVKCIACNEELIGRTKPEPLAATQREGVYECQENHETSWEFLDSWYGGKVYHESFICPICKHNIETTTQIKEE